MKSSLHTLQEDVLRELKKQNTHEDVHALRERVFSRKSGTFTVLSREMSRLSSQERKEYGAHMNEVKRALEEAFADKEKELDTLQWEAIGESERIDITQPNIPHTMRGYRHPMSMIHEELEDLFVSMGFLVLDGPELESEYYNFEALNIPDTHPARDSHDTFFIKNHPKWVMRTHTSPVQVRAMQKYGAPLRAVVAGRCFRNEATDASHEHTFYQMEGLVIDKNISIAHLIGVMKELLRGVLHREVDVRLRPGYFPFTEPSFELDMKCLVCGGTGCGACKQSGWIETLPCGLVHPNVIKAGGLDPDEWTGFAFGLGSMRLCMQKYGIEDIRQLHNGDLNFLQQF